MPLSDLVKHIPTQGEAIKRFAPGLDPNTPACTLWRGFRESLWGKGTESFLKEEEVKRDVNPVKTVPAPPPLPNKPHPTRVVAIIPESLSPTWDLQSRKILVRSEYKEAEGAALSVTELGIDLFAINGQPGIGKSVFLLLLLMHRLALKLPTILQHTATNPILFHEAGVSEFRHLDNHPDFNALYFPTGEHLSRIWALIDTNPKLPDPAGIFKQGTPFFVIDAISPRSEHVGWLDKTGYKEFYMNPWSIWEVFQARPFLGRAPCTEYQLWYLYNQFGASPRALATYAHNPKSYEAHLNKKLNEIESDDLLPIFRNPASSAVSHYIITIYPSKASREIPEKKFASRRVFDMVWDRHLCRRLDLMEEF